MPTPMRDTTSAVRVLVVDDHELFRDAARAVVHAAAGFVLAGEAATGEGALAQAPHARPDIVLMDVRMPGMGGIEAGRLFGEQYPDTVVLLLSATVSGESNGHEPRGPVILEKSLLDPELLRSVWESARGVRS
jgi:CheY-like chemotaxis protein